MGGPRRADDEGLEGLDHNFLTGTLEDLVKWARARSQLAAPRSAWPAAPSR